VGWTGGWEMFRGLNEASCCARGRAHSDRASECLATIGNFGIRI